MLCVNRPFWNFLKKKIPVASIIIVTIEFGLSVFLAAGRNCFEIYFHRFAQRTAKDCKRAYKCCKGLLIIRKSQTKKNKTKNKKDGRFALTSTLWWSGNALLLYMAVIIVYNRKRQRSATFCGNFHRRTGFRSWCSFKSHIKLSVD